MKNSANLVKKLTKSVSREDLDMFEELLLKNSRKNKDLHRVLKKRIMANRLSREVDDLFKASKAQLEQMIGKEAKAPHHQTAIKEIRSMFPNSSHDVWLTKHYKADPSVLSNNREALKHLSGQMSIHDKLKYHDVSKMSFEDGLKSLQDRDRELTQEAASKFTNHHYRPSDETSKVLTTGDGRSWFNINKPECRTLGLKLGHCGNSGDPHYEDKLHYLATEHRSSNGDRLHDPTSTFILNNGYLGEMKGKFNKKPELEDHRAIVDLLKQPNINGIIGGGHEPYNNFSLSDLSDNLKKELLAVKPDIDPLNTMSELDSNHFPDKFESDINKHNRVVRLVRHHDGNVDNIIDKYKKGKGVHEEDISDVITHAKIHSSFSKKQVHDLIEHEIRKLKGSSAGDSEEAA